MAKIVSNSKGFKVIEIKAVELMEGWCKRAEYFEEDRPYEENSFNRMVTWLKEKNLLEEENADLKN